MRTLDALIEDSLTLISTSHLPCLVVHLVVAALWAVLLHNDLLDLGRFLHRLGIFHPLFPLVELLLCHHLIPNEVSNGSHVLAEAAFSCLAGRVELKHHTTVVTEDG